MLYTKLTDLATRVRGDIQSWIVGDKARSRPHLDFDSGVAPTVDVLITYCGEGVDLLLDTVRAACALDYPRERYRIVVLDDSCSPSTKKAVQKLAMTLPNLHYTSRGIAVDTHSKAANLNHGLLFTKGLDPKGNGSELVAGLDVDMIPVPGWLKVLVPQVTTDDSVAMACIPQSFYNIQIGDPLGQMPPLAHYQEINALQMNALGASLAGGSGYVARRVAIENVGGMPEDAIVEDIIVSMKLLRAGWKIVYVKKPLQWGLMPDSFAGHLKQRQRWMAGAFSIGDALHQTISKSPRWELKLGLGLLIFESTVSLIVVLQTLCFLAMPFILLSGRTLVLHQSLYQRRFLLRLAMVDMAAQTLHGALMSWHTAFTIYVFHEVSEMWLQSYFLQELLRHWAPKWSLKCLGTMPKFTPGGSVASRSPERDNRYRHLCFSRLKLILWDHGALLHLLVLVSTLAGVCITLLNTQEMGWFLIRGGWPPCVLMWTSVIGNAWVPINYAIFTPKKPQREELLVCDPVSNVAYPSQEAKQSNCQRVVEWRLGCVFMYTCFIALQVL